MGYITAIVALTLLPITLAAETCPPPNQLTPCTCDREGVNCNAATNLDQIKKAFKATFPYKGVSNVWIQGTPITNISQGIFGNVMSLAFYIEMNQLDTVAKEAFYPSKEHLETLSFFGNNLKDFWYGSLKDFPALMTLNLGRNKLTSIPANCFSHEHLQTIVLSQNSIDSIGPNAFYDLPLLMRVELSLNSLTTLGPLSFHHEGTLFPPELGFIQNKISSISNTAFQGIRPIAVYLSGNSLTSLKEEAFSSLMDRMMSDGGVLEVSENPLTCKGCDYRWLMEGKSTYYNHIIGLVCPDGTGMLDLTSSSIEC